MPLTQPLSTQLTHPADSWSPEKIRKEWSKCKGSPSYFIHHYCNIYDATDRDWIEFKLWPGQLVALDAIHNNRLVVVLKSRQLGLTWLALGYSLWLMLFKPIATVLLFSRRDDEAIYLLGEERLKGMYKRLPNWMKAQSVAVSSSHEFRLSNGSTARAFPTTGGDSYTASFVVVDEADLVPNLNDLMRSTKPTIDAGGGMLLISRVNKRTPNSEFQRIYKAARDGQNTWKGVFLSWRTRLTRDQAWYEALKKDILSRTGTLDELWEQYPDTDEEALAPISTDKRIPAQWLLECYQPFPEIESQELVGISLPGLHVYQTPEHHYHYVIGADPAEGNPTSDDSAAVVFCMETGEQVAALWGKFQTSTFASYIHQLGIYYNQASILVERNNHGHAILIWLQDNSHLVVLEGWDVDPDTKKRKKGWLNNSKGKSLLYSTLVEGFQHRLPRLRTYEVYSQLTSIEGSTLKAPKGDHDDLAVAAALAWAAASRPMGVYFS